VLFQVILHTLAPLHDLLFLHILVRTTCRILSVNCFEAIEIALVTSPGIGFGTNQSLQSIWNRVSLDDTLTSDSPKEHQAYWNVAAYVA